MWLGQNWFSLAETLGIVAGLLFTAFTVRQDIRERRLTNLMALTGQHRDIWKTLYERPGLARLLSPAANPERQPLTRQETLFVTLVVLHLSTVHRAIKHGLVSQVGGSGRTSGGSSACRCRGRCGSRSSHSRTRILRNSSKRAGGRRRPIRSRVVVRLAVKFSCRRNGG